MPTYRVSGADRETGKDVTQMVVAKSPDEATTKVQAKMFVSGVGLSVSNQSSSASPVEYASQELSKQTPGYSGLKIVASLAWIYAMLLYLRGAAAIVIGVFMIVNPGAAGSARRDSSAEASLFVIGLSTIFGAVVTHAIAGGCDALRDIARNSFR